MRSRVFLSLVLVFHLVSIANATVIDVVTDGIGDKGHEGTIEDPLEVGENIDIKIFLNLNPYPGFSSYDGYLLSEMDVGLQVSGPGTLTMVGLDKGGLLNIILSWHPGFTSTDVSPETVDELVAQQGFDFLYGQSTNGIPGPATLVEAGAGSFYDLYIYVEGQGNIHLDLSLHGTTKYSPYKTAASSPYEPYPGGWIDATNSDLGDLTIYAVPEPATITLLGLAGLILLKKRKP